MSMQLILYSLLEATKLLGIICTAESITIMYCWTVTLDKGCCGKTCLWKLSHEFQVHKEWVNICVYMCHEVPTDLRWFQQSSSTALSRHMGNRGGLLSPFSPSLVVSCLTSDQMRSGHPVPHPSQHWLSTALKLLCLQFIQFFWPYSSPDSVRSVV